MNDHRYLNAGDVGVGTSEVPSLRSTKEIQMDIFASCDSDI